MSTSTSTAAQLQAADADTTSGRSIPAPGRRTGRRWLARIAAMLATVAVGLVTLVSTEANAADAVYGGTIGPIYGYGATVCNPLRAGGIARSYVEIGSPLVGPSRAVYRPNVHVIGGAQPVNWQGYLEKYVGNRWIRVWTGAATRPITYANDLFTFGDPWVDTRQLGANSGPGYYRSGGAVVWGTDSTHPAGGWLSYYHGVGNYFKDAWANYNRAGATPLTTAYCWAG